MRWPFCVSTAAGTFSGNDAAMNILIDKVGPITTLTINRARLCNAVDRPTAQALADALREFEAAAKRFKSGHGRHGSRI